MSASREKNKRKEQSAAPETANETKKGMSKGLKTTLIAVCAVLVVCIVVFFYMLTSGFLVGLLKATQSPLFHSQVKVPRRKAPILNKKRKAMA